MSWGGKRRLIARPAPRSRLSMTAGQWRRFLAAEVVPPPASRIIWQLGGSVAESILRVGDRVSASDYAAKGRELEPHITLIGGLSAKVNPARVRSVLGRFEQISAEVGELTVIPASPRQPADVLAAEVRSPELAAIALGLAGELRAEAEGDGPGAFIPIAYVRPGRAGSYAAADLRISGTRLGAEELVLLTPDGKRHLIWDRTVVATGRPTVCVDFDNTIAATGKYVPGEVDAAALPGAAEGLAELARTYRVVVLTARPVAEVTPWLEAQGLTEHIELVTNTKVPAIAYIDDRAVPFGGSWRDAVGAVRARERWGAAATERTVILGESAEVLDAPLRIAASAS